MFENPRRGRQARNFTTNAPKILDLKSSSEQIFSRKLPLGAPETRLKSSWPWNLFEKHAFSLFPFLPLCLDITLTLPDQILLLPCSPRLAHKAPVMQAKEYLRQLSQREGVKNLRILNNMSIKVSLRVFIGIGTLRNSSQWKHLIVTFSLSVAKQCTRRIAAGTRGYAFSS